MAADKSKFKRQAVVHLGNIGQAGDFFTDAIPLKEINKILSKIIVNTVNTVNTADLQHV